MPKVSVIIPVYNAEVYLRECLDSVINQTLSDIEIVCVDDSSTDSSYGILREYAEMLPETTDRFIMGSRVFSDNIVSLFDATDIDMNTMISFAEFCSSKFADKVQKEYFGSNVVCVVGLCPFVVTIVFSEQYIIRL